jgi:hypothetical protein
MQQSQITDTLDLSVKLRLYCHILCEILDFKNNSFDLKY